MAKLPHHSAKVTVTLTYSEWTDVLRAIHLSQGAQFAHGMKMSEKAVMMAAIEEVRKKLVSKLADTILEARKRT